MRVARTHDAAIDRARERERGRGVLRFDRGIVDAKPVRGVIRAAVIDHHDLLRRLRHNSWKLRSQ